MLKEYVKNNLIRSDGNINYAKIKLLDKQMTNEIECLIGRSLKEKLFCLLNGIHEIPKCSICGTKECKFIGFKAGYCETCSNECSRVLGVMKHKDTCLKKYGVESTNKLESIKNKKRKTYLEKYGVDWIFKSDEIKKKSKETILKRYGVDHQCKCPEILKKREETCINRYGVPNVLSVKEVRQKGKDSLMRKYGVDNPLKCQEIKEKVIQTNIKRYRC